MSFPRACLPLILAATLHAAEVKLVPPHGIAVPDAEKKSLENALTQLRKSISQLRQMPAAAPLLPDVEIYERAVHYALTYDEFFKPDEIWKAQELLRHGQSRAEALLKGSAPWTTQTGLVVRGYRSEIDDSIQPYGLVVPGTYAAPSPLHWRLDTWFHGRGEMLSEVNFLWDRERNPGEFTPLNTFVVHLYGRFCNANKFAGEVDLFEALDAVKHSYPIDDNRILIRGFSMGGAAAWHIATHHAGLWAAAAPGAGFSETAVFTKAFKSDPKPTSWEQTLWHWYDAADYALNLFNVPTVAYSGEDDPQQQAARAVETALKAEGLTLTHIIGPHTGHRYHPDSKIEINRRLDAIATIGREVAPRHIRFVTYTLRYNQMKWITVDRLTKHWERATVDARITGDNALTVDTQNIADFSIDMPSGASPFDPSKPVTITVNGKPVSAAPPQTDRSFHWSTSTDTTLAKRHALQGPIDDAFLSRFIFVRPTGNAASPETAAWAKSELDRAIREWRRVFRGEPLVKDDSAITPQDIASANLILWGDPASNLVYSRIASKLPLAWPKESKSALVMIYPNPENQARYVVINSGFTFRESANTSNARQLPVLPDWAIVDTSTPPDDHWPGRIASAGFFNEQWK
jgi:predicted esterase